MVIESRWYNPGMITILDIGVGICKATCILVATLVCSGIYFVGAVFAVGAYGDTHGLWSEGAAMAFSGALSASLLLYVWFALAVLDDKLPRGRVLVLVLSPFALAALLLAPLGALVFLVYMAEFASM